MTTPAERAAELAAARYGATTKKRRPKGEGLDPADYARERRARKAVISFEADPEVAAALIAVADHRGVSKAEALRQLIAEAAEGLEA